MNRIQVTPLGAGRDVGRSCLLLSINDHNILLDCGMHMGFEDERRFPDFSYISTRGNFDRLIDCVIVSHFHLDHCGSLPYFTEMCGYNGPIYMTAPTQAICPLLLEDYRKISVDRKGETNFFTSEDIDNCMSKVTSISLHQTINVSADLEIKAFYAGHVLGAAMFWVRSGNQSVVYTGDYNTTPDRHLGAAWIDRVCPNLLITESTYGSTIRDSKKAREADFLHKVHTCVLNGGKVLIPVFALGRAQELCILIDSYWERMGLTVPVYFAGGMTAKANHYYRLFINWTNQKLKQTFMDRNMFDFKHIKNFEMGFADSAGPQVVFASPGMLHAGFSFEIFKKWAPEPRNMVILPGYCVPGTVGARVLAGHKKIKYDGGEFEVNLQVKHLSFSAHADSKGIVQMIKQSGTESVVLVHGEESKMEFLSQVVEQDIGIPCHYPANGTTLTLDFSPRMTLEVDPSCLGPKNNRLRMDSTVDSRNLHPQNYAIVSGKVESNKQGNITVQSLPEDKFCVLKTVLRVPSPATESLVAAWKQLSGTVPQYPVHLTKDGSLEVSSVVCTVKSQTEVEVEWSLLDSDVVNKVVDAMPKLV